LGLIRKLKVCQSAKSEFEVGGDGRFFVKKLRKKLQTGKDNKKAKAT
jgi:hypothetical protein